MTTNRQLSDSEGEFGGWRDHSHPCNRTVVIGHGENAACGAKVRYRCWESSDGAYEDYQYRCENGHTWWVDGIDS